MAELIVYQTVLSGEIIYNGTLLILFVNNLEEKPKDYLYIYICVVSFFKKGRINTHICHKASCGNHSLQ